MRAILGIDAAWTDQDPSGIALAVEDAGGWHLHGLWPSYAAFLGGGSGTPAPRTLLDRVQDLTGALPDLVTLDMPLSLDPITSRRAADTAVSRAFGGRGAATHSPGTLRPGAISDSLRAGFDDTGYALRTTATPGRLAEVYPHPALINFRNAARRLPYKLSRIAKYWPDLRPPARRQRLFEQWAIISLGLDAMIAGSSAALGQPNPNGTLAALKSHEDQLDAIICAAIGIAILDGHAQAYGDDRAAIWVPDPAEQSAS